MLPGVKRLAGLALLACLAAGCGKTAAPTTTISATGQQSEPKAASPAELRSLSGQLGHPIYWIGEQSGKTYELTRFNDGRVFIRYLPQGVKVGTTRALYTILGPYPVQNAHGVLEKLAKKSGELSFTAPHNGLGVFSTSRPTNVYVAYPGSNLEIEVFDPSPDRARKLITSGQVKPVS